MTIPALPPEGDTSWYDWATGIDTEARLVTNKLDASAAPELIRDTIAAALVAGTGMTITVNDAGDTITLESSGGASYTDEQVRDVVAAALVAGSNVTITPNDGSDTITIAASGGGSSVLPTGSTDPGSPATGYAYINTVTSRLRMWTGSLWMSATLAAEGSALVWDSFTRADSASSLGSAETGQAWTAHAGTWGISSNRAYLASGTGAKATVDAGAANMDVRLTLSTRAAAGTFAGMLVRYVDTNNFLILQDDGGNNRWALYKRVAGAYTLLGSTTPAPASGDVMRVVANGSSLTVYRNGTSVITATDAAHSTATRAGFQAEAADATRFDDFAVLAV